MKIQLKKKNLTIISGLTILCLLFVSLNVNSALNVTIEDISYPTSVKLDSTFEVKVAFKYLTSSACIYGNYIYLKYEIRTANNVPLEMKTIPYRIVQNPKPSRVTFSLDTSEMTLGSMETDATFKFKIEYTPGIIDQLGVITQSGSKVSTEWYELTISKAGILTDSALPLWAIILIGVVVVAALVTITIFWRKRR